MKVTILRTSNKGAKSNAWGMGGGAKRGKVALQSNYWVVGSVQERSVTKERKQTGD